MKAQFTIRPGLETDLPALLNLICGLAEYEREPESVTNTIAQMQRDGFGPNAIFTFVLAEVEGKHVGMAVWYWRYSTWRGRVLYLEDFYVEPEFRGLGIGKALFKHVVNIAKEQNSPRLCFQVLDWNQPAIDFYHRMKGEVGDDFLNAWVDAQHYDAIVG